jgi:hypothetical protein
MSQERLDRFFLECKVLHEIVAPNGLVAAHEYLRLLKVARQYRKACHEFLDGPMVDEYIRIPRTKTDLELFMDGERINIKIGGEPNVFILSDKFSVSGNATGVWLFDDMQKKSSGLVARISQHGSWTRLPTGEIKVKTKTEPGDWDAFLATCRTHYGVEIPANLKPQFLE